VREKRLKFSYIIILGLLSAILFASCSSNTGLPALESKILELTITLPGTDSSTIFVNEQGRILENTRISSSNGNIGLTIDKGTTLLDENGKPLQSLKVIIDPLIPVPPENAEIVGVIVDMQPQKAIAQPWLKLTLTYDPSSLPQGLIENDLWIYGNTGNTWNLISYRQIDTEANRITTTISTFERYSILALTKRVETTTPQSQQSLTSITLPQALINGKPTLAEFGRGTCIPCKQMKPVLENLAIAYQDKLNVSIVSIDDYRDLTTFYKIMAIPTQIIFDSNGKEVFRHVGFWAKDQIITQLDKLSIK
jgi:thioredoxin 1